MNTLTARLATLSAIAMVIGVLALEGVKWASSLTPSW